MVDVLARPAIPRTRIGATTVHFGPMQALTYSTPIAIRFIAPFCPAATAKWIRRGLTHRTSHSQPIGSRRLVMWRTHTPPPTVSATRLARSKRRVAMASSRSPRRRAIPDWASPLHGRDAASRATGPRRDSPAVTTTRMEWWTRTKAASVLSYAGTRSSEGSEECDPPADGACSDDCKVIHTASPCDQCRGPSCANEYGACYSASPSLKTGCIATFGCFTNSKCTDDLLSCYCGTLSATVCTTQEGNGPCKDTVTTYIKGDTGCGDNPTPACIENNFTTPGNSVGLASLLVQCQQNFCYDQCFGSTTTP